MKFQDSSFNGLKVTVGTKSVTHARTHPRSKSNMPHQLFKVGGIKNLPLRNHKVDDADTFHTCLLHYPLHKLCFCFNKVRTLWLLWQLFSYCCGYTWPKVR